MSGRSGDEAGVAVFAEHVDVDLGGFLAPGFQGAGVLIETDAEHPVGGFGVAVGKRLTEARALAAMNGGRLPSFETATTRASRGTISSAEKK